MEQAFVALQAEQWSQAEPLFLQILAEDPQSARACQGLALIAESQAKWSEAFDLYAQSLQLNPQDADTHHHLAILYAQHQQPDKARHHFEQALALAPTALYHHNLALLLVHLGYLEQAHGHWAEALRLQPDWREVRCQLANSYLDNGWLTESLHVMQQGRTDIYTAADWLLLGRIYESLGYYPEATHAYQQTLPEFAGEPALWRRLIECALGQGLHRQALDAASQCVRVSATCSDRFKRVSLIPPPISHGKSEIQYWREQLAQEIENLLSQPVPNAFELPLTTPHFYLAFQGLDDRELLNQLAALYQRLLPFSNERSFSAQTVKRVGVVSHHFANHSVMHCFLPLLYQLNLAGFELFLFATPGLVGDTVTKELGQWAHLKHLPNDLRQAHHTMLHAELDLLIYLDIGMDAFSYFLAFGRAAPYQCVLSGHPVTTGIPTIDYFISSELLESPEAQAHYSEKLVCLPDVLVHYEFPQQAIPLKSRAQLGLPEQGNLYICPMTLFKIHPDFDPLLQQILVRDPNAQVILFRQPPFQQELQARFSQTIPLHSERLHFIPWASSSDFLQILAQANVVLDSIHFGAGNTAYLCLAAGAPMVTWPAAFLRGRVTAGLYRQMGLLDCIATDFEDYVEKALRIAQDSSYRQQLSREIEQRRGVVFYNDRGIEAFIDWIRALP